MTAQPNWPLLNREVVRHLQDLLRLDTTNPPGNETLAAEHIARVLKKDDIEPILLESVPGRGNVVARLKGTGEKPPLLLYSHTDVVGAEPERWTHPPFSGTIADGQVWGRGALDMKGTVAQQLTVFLLLKRQNVALKRDVIFAATANEEVGDPEVNGVAWLVRHHPQLLQAEFGITEVGGYSTEMGGKTLYPIQVAEKGLIWLKARIKGRPGHGSLPQADNAIVHLSSAIERLARQGLPYHLVGAADGFLSAVAAGVGGSLGEALARLRSPLEAPGVLQSAFPDEGQRSFFYAMLHNTVSPTGLQAGYQANVIPGQAEATLDGRTLPGFDAGTFLAELGAVLGEGFEFEVILEAPPLETAYQTPLFKLMADRLRQHDPGAVAAPYMMSGATDAKYLSQLGVPSYGFAPLKLPRGFPYLELFHAHDERVPIHGLGWGMRVLYEVVREYCS